MNATHKSNLKQIRDTLLVDENEINNDFSDNQESDSESEYDFAVTESNDTFNSEHISEESDLSNFDIEQGDVVTASRPETLRKNDEILDEIVPHTILYAKRYFDQKIRSRQDSNSIRLDSHCWKPIDRIELESFIGLLIQSDVNRSDHEVLYDLWDISQSRPLYHIAAINSMTIWLCQNSEWNKGRTNTRRMFLSQLSMALSDSQNQRRSQQSRLKPKVKLALLSLGYHL
ncbi:unnamed protein product [Rotaria sordida]|uniref:PiggyBac transposable element-derived protein domain-containing protein n=1 Tax=Rotaria sordida TaxID=392033 RepID=A0A815CTN0_9BILA|nr:unnamed protein product [Rotaria sordida]CAF3825053.1 unnamed protein product [Rotaria sordida]